MSSNHSRHLCIYQAPYLCRTHSCLFRNRTCRTELPLYSFFYYYCSFRNHTV